MVTHLIGPDPVRAARGASLSAEMPSCLAAFRIQTSAALAGRTLAPSRVCPVWEGSDRRAGVLWSEHGPGGRGGRPDGGAAARATCTDRTGLHRRRGGGPLNAEEVGTARAGHGGGDGRV